MLLYFLDCLSLLLILTLYCWVRWHEVPFFESLVWLDQGLSPSLLDYWRTLKSLGQWIELFQIELFTCIKYKVWYAIKPEQTNTPHPKKTPKKPQTFDEYFMCHSLESKNILIQIFMKFFTDMITWQTYFSVFFLLNGFIVSGNIYRL